MSTAKPSTYILSTLGVLSASALAYALYFDYKRRHDTDFRRALKRESKKQARAAREQAEEQGRKGRTEIREMVDAAIEEGFPPTAEEKEIYFMERLSEGEGLCQKSSKQKEAALCFFKALKVYPQPKELMTLYDRTVLKPILDILAEMVAYDNVSDGGSVSSSGGGVE